jgi:hypothetical protein
LPSGSLKRSTTAHLTDVGTGCAERCEASDLGDLVVGPEVEMQSVLDGLLFRDTSKKEAGDASEEATATDDSQEAGSLPNA